jgi:ABC-type polysaccharide/polyol phosphate export permease
MTLLHRLVAFIFKLYRYRGVIWAMAVRDLDARYVGSFGGILWTVVHPLATVLIYWFVFSVGFKAHGPAGMPFVLYFVSGLVPWLLFSEVLNSSINAVTANAQLVKKTIFPSEVLPLVHLTSASFTHLVLLAVLCFLAWYYGYGPTLSTIYTVYYYGALGCFHRDLGQGMSVVLSLWFWLTPIVWSAEVIPAQYRSILEYNPIYYIVEGYRASLMTDQVVWVNWRGGLRFWAVTGPIFLMGAYVFRRLKPDFADVL